MSDHTAENPGIDHLQLWAYGDFVTLAGMWKTEARFIVRRVLLMQALKLDLWFLNNISQKSLSEQPLNNIVNMLLCQLFRI
jgi:hypothetical protein